MNQYVKEIEEFYLKLKKSSFFLSSKEREIILKWYKQKIPVEVIKQKIKEEYIKFPVKKSKKFNLLIVDKNLNKTIKEPKNKKIIKKTTKPKTDIERNVSLIWKNLPKEEKNKIKKEAVLQLKELRLSKDEYKEAIKILIKKIIEERYINQ